MSDFYAQYKDPRWQKKRLEVFDRDGWECSHCGASTNELHVHHVRYQTNKKVWEYEDQDLRTLCRACHSFVTETTREARAAFYDLMELSPEAGKSMIEAANCAMHFCPEAAEMLDDLGRLVGRVVIASATRNKRFHNDDYMAMLTALDRCREALAAIERGDSDAKN